MCEILGAGVNTGEEDQIFWLFKHQVRCGFKILSCNLLYFDINYIIYITILQDGYERRFLLACAFVHVVLDAACVHPSKMLWTYFDSHKFNNFLTFRSRKLLYCPNIELRCVWWIFMARIWNKFENYVRWRIGRTLSAFRYNSVISEVRIIELEYQINIWCGWIKVLKK